MTQDRTVAGIVMMLGFCAVAPLIDVTAKLAAPDVPVSQINLARFVVQAAIMAPVCLVLGHGLRMGAGTFWRLVARSACLIGASYCFIAAIAVMPIADALAIVFVEPFVILILGHLIFGDAVGPHRIGASAVGFLGALLVIQPSFQTFGAVALYPLGTAMFFAAYMLVTRGLGKRMHPIPMQYHTATVAAALCLPAMLLAQATGFEALPVARPQGLVWLWLVGVGFFSTVAHLMMTYALRYAASATLAPLHYLEIVSAATFGYLVFGDFPNLLTWSGIAVIVVSGLYIIQRERLQARRVSVVLPPQAAAAQEQLR